MALPMLLRGFIPLASALAVIIAPGCSSDENPDGGSSDAGATVPASAEQVALPDPIPATGAKRAKLSDRLLEQLTITDGPDWTVFAFGSLWVKRDNGFVARVDPETAEIIAQIGPGGSGEDVVGAPGGHLCQGIGASAEAIWSCPREGAVARIDPETNSVAATVRIDKLPDQGRLVSAADRVWILTGTGDELAAIDPRTNRPAATIDLGGRCSELAAAGETVWAMCPLEDRLLRIDAEAAKISGELALAGATNGSASDELWVAFDGGVAQVDPEALEVLAVYELFPQYGGSVFATPDAVWVREEGRFLSRIDPSAQRIVETVGARDLPSGGDVVQIGDSVWATAYDDVALVELRASGP